MLRNTENRILLSFVLIAAILGVIGYFAYNHVKTFNDLNDKTLSTYETIAANQELFSLAKDMETAARGYILTGEGDYLQPFYNAKTAYKDRLTVLKHLAQQKPAIQNEVDSLEKFLEIRRQVSEDYVALRQAKGLDSAVALVKQGQGRKISEKIWQVSRKIRQKEGEALRILLRKNYENLQSSANALVGLIAVILATLAFVYIIFRNDISGRMRAEKKLQELNRDLEQKVEDRTEDLRRSFEDTEAKVKFRNLELEKQNRELKRRNDELEARK
jgi:CHASE3 domain sensor protein